MAIISSLIEFGWSVKDEITNEPITQEDLDSGASSVQSEWGSV
jgi:phospholipase/lecithinase/hemolysin